MNGNQIAQTGKEFIPKTPDYLNKMMSSFFFNKPLYYINLQNDLNLYKPRTKQEEFEL